MSSRSKPSIKDLNGLRANPATIIGPEQSRTRQAPPGSVATQSKASRPSTSHSNSGVPREARAKDDSFREFADFLRSTGPAPGTMSPQKSGPPIAEPRPIKALPATSPRPDSEHGVSKKITKQNPTTNSRQMTGQQSANPAATNQQQNSRRTDPVKSKKPIPKLQPRDATTSSDSTLELAEFLRQGPTDVSEGRLRLPRTGEPPRLVAGTNDVQRISNGKSRDGENSRTSVASTQVSSVPSKSIQSVNSRTGLLESSNTAADGRGSTEKRPPREEETPYPVRKQRRFKDPYALDADSENDEDDQATGQRHEESLIDFLNSVTPPPSPPANQAAFTAGAQSSKGAPPQKSHYPSMRERLTRNGVSANSIDTRSQQKQPQMGVPSIVKRKSEIRQPMSNDARGKAPMPRPEGSKPANRGRPEASRAGSNNKNNQAPQLPPFNPRETSPHLISQVGSKFDTYRITHPTYAAHVDRERNGPRRSPVQPYQARSEHDPVNGMSDLADFLRNSEPPPDVPKRPVSPAKEKDGGFGRMFSRRKKSIH